MEKQAVQKDSSMIIQKEMMADYFARLSKAKTTNKKVVYTFVPGNMVELISSFDMIPVYPEINALQSGMRKKSDGYIQEAEKIGHSEDVCTYVKCDIGMMLTGNLGPTGEEIPPPDLLLCTYAGCFTFMKWFENLSHIYNAPVLMLHIPYQIDGKVSRNTVDYVVDQLKREVIPVLEKISGNKYDEDKLKEKLKLSSLAEENLVYTFQSAKNIPSPIDAFFAGVYYVGPIFTSFRGSERCVEFYSKLRQETDERVKNKLGPVTPEGELIEERYRLVMEGTPSWTNFRDLWKFFYDEGAVCVASTYTKVGGLYDQGFRHNPSKPLETLAEYASGVYGNLSLPVRINLLEKYIKEYQADGFVINSIKSCNSYSAGQLLIMQELEKRTGLAGGFIESDLVDSRYFSHANIKTRLESYFQMIDQKRRRKS